jgi:hypothetical protein
LSLPADFRPPQATDGADCLLPVAHELCRPRHRAIQEWLGHGSITGTAVYAALAPNRFKDFWRG